ncbi:MAG: hypothetical protein HY717_13200 [Planctomycetes bacterium]|nr:hypothetical protein [Planctomycetota bacterium]
MEGWLELVEGEMDISHFEIDPLKVVVGPGKSRGSSEATARDVKTDILKGERPALIQGSHPGDSEIIWRTTNRKGKPVELKLVSSPACEKVTAGRTWGRIPETHSPPQGDGEVDHPFVSFRHSGAGAARITATLVWHEEDRPAHG